MDADALQTYFAAERLTGAILAIYGVVILGAAAYLHHTHTGAFMWGLVVPLGLLGLGAVVGGSVLAIKTGPQLDALIALATPELLAQELPRMQKVNANWVWLKSTWTVLIAASLVVLWTVKRDGANGVALAFLVAASSAMVLDVFAERRARVYTAALEQHADG
jgi:hypothetical protein